MIELVMTVAWKVFWARHEGGGPYTDMEIFSKKGVNQGPILDGLLDQFKYLD